LFLKGLDNGYGLDPDPDGYSALNVGVGFGLNECGSAPWFSSVLWIRYPVGSEFFYGYGQPLSGINLKQNF